MQSMSKGIIMHFIIIIIMIMISSPISNK